MHKIPAEINPFQYQPTVTDSPSTFEAKLHKKLKWTRWYGLKRLLIWIANHLIAYPLRENFYLSPAGIIWYIVGQ